MGEQESIRPDLYKPMSDTLKTQPPKKSNKGRNVIIIVLVLIILGLGGYVIYDKFFIKEKPAEEVKKEEVKQEIKVTNLDVTSTEVTSLYNNIDVFAGLFDSEAYNAYLYRTDNLKATDMPNDVISFIGFTHALRECGKACETEQSDATVKVSVPRDKVSNQIKKIFGNITYQDSDIKKVNCAQNNIKYNQSTKAYEYRSYGCGYGVEDTNKTETKITKAEKTDKEINIYVKVAFEFMKADVGGDENGTYDHSQYFIYSEYEKINQVAKIAAVDDNSLKAIFETYGDKLPTYKLTFVNQNGNYVFTEVSKVK